MSKERDELGMAGGTSGGPAEFTERDLGTVPNPRAHRVRGGEVPFFLEADDIIDFQLLTGGRVKLTSKRMILVESCIVKIIRCEEWSDADAVHGQVQVELWLCERGWRNGWRPTDLRAV